MVPPPPLKKRAKSKQKNWEGDDFDLVLNRKSVES